MVSTPIGNLGDLSPRAAEALSAADVIACEDTRHSRKLLSHLGAKTPRLVSSNAHNERDRVRELIAAVAAGRRVVLVTDAGTPAVSDPGQALVEAAVEAGLAVEVIPGPSAVLAALVASGLSSERFCFEGFLPRKGAARAARLAALADEERTTVLFEAPSRVPTTLADLAEVCDPDRSAAVARELTKLHEEVDRGTLGELLRRWEVPRRGEHVLVVGGASVRSAEVSDSQVIASVAGHLAAGMGRRDAAGAVAEALGVSRRRAYELGLGAPPSSLTQVRQTRRPR